MWYREKCWEIFTRGVSRCCDGVMPLIEYSIVVSTLEIAPSTLSSLVAHGALFRSMWRHNLRTDTSTTVRPIHRPASTSGTLFVNVKLQIVRARIMRVLSQRKSIYQVYLAQSRLIPASNYPTRARERRIRTLTRRNSRDIRCLARRHGVIA